LLRPKNVSIELKAAAGLTEIEADPRLLQQVFVNLITNAEQAITSARDSGTIRVSVSQNEGKIVFEFADDGPGIPAPSLSKIFDPFFTTKRPGGGTGLGLTIAIAIAKEHGGTIEADSASGEGARFQVVLPVAVEESLGEASDMEAPRRPTATRPLAGSSPLHGHSVYVVDDEESIREIVQEGLGARGMTVEGASSSEEALAHLAHRSYDFIICDFNLPGLNGGQFFVHARFQPGTAATKFIFMTGALLDTETASRFTQNGASMLQKPFHIAALAALLAELMPHSLSQPK
jgi:CheY-like chemotaxis protein